MIEHLTEQVVVFATEIAAHAAQLPSVDAREAYLLERRRELLEGARAEGIAEPHGAILADACIDAARRIMAALVARGVGSSQLSH